MLVVLYLALFSGSVFAQSSANLNALNNLQVNWRKTDWRVAQVPGLGSSCTDLRVPHVRIFGHGIAQISTRTLVIHSSGR
jgi:hypothetical protein